MAARFVEARREDSIYLAVDDLITPPPKKIDINS